MGLITHSQQYVVDGYVIEESLFVPVEGQIVEIKNENGIQIASALTNESGYFEKEITLPAGDQFLTLSLDRNCSGIINTYNADLDLDSPHLCYIFEVCEDIPCEARFNYEQQSPNNLFFQFTDVSQVNAYTWEWDFDDGTTSSQQNPLHLFESPGQYQVTLTITGENCNTESQRTVFVDYQSRVAKFSFEQVNQGEQPAINFTNNSIGYYIYNVWYFGDGSETSLETNPKHAYGQPGFYNVSLTLVSKFGSSTLVKAVHVKPTPGCFALFNHEQILSSDLLVQFEDMSAGKSLLYWYWEFGDGYSAEDQNPAHIYQDTGTYEVSVRVISTSGQSYYTRDIKVIESTGCIADFAWIQPDPDNPQVVFNSLTPNGNLIFDWEFGDGETSSLKSPAHQYDDFGTYEVSLNVLGYGCGDNFSQTITIEEPVYCDAKFTWEQDFPQSRTINFINQSYGNETTYLWHFGDGQTSDDENPVHTYQSAGSYNIELIINTSDGCSDTTFANLEILPPLKLSGNVFAGDNAISMGRAYLYLVEEGGQIQYIGNSLLDDGHYEFSELIPGNYFVQAIPVYDFPIPVIPFYSAVYSGGTLKWQDALTINTATLPADVNLSLVSYNDFFTGKGSIAGIVLRSANPDNIPLLFYLTNGESEIYRFVLAEPEIRFSFDDVPFGNYSLIPEKPGKICEPFHLILDVDFPDIRDIVFMETDATIKPDLSSISESISQADLILFPNPANQFVTIGTLENKVKSIALRIFDASTMQKMCTQNVKSGERISVANLKTGIYVVVAACENHISYHKLIVR